MTQAQDGAQDERSCDINGIRWKTQANHGEMCNMCRAFLRTNENGFKFELYNISIKLQIRQMLQISQHNAALANDSVDVSQASFC